MSALDLEPHEQLDEIDRRTNDDGTVEVTLLRWKKNDYNDRVDVHYRIPTGETKSESMKWPKSNDPSFKFIRLIEETPYTLRTADSINDDDTLKLNAHPDSWDLVLPEEKKLREHIPISEKGVPFEIAKFLLYPLSVIAMMANLAEKDSEYVGFRGEPYDSTYLDNDMHKAKHISAVKSAIYTFFWIVLLAVLIL